jgi:LysM repeat protein
VTLWAGVLVVTILLAAGLMGLPPFKGWWGVLAGQMPDREELAAWMSTVLPTLEFAVGAGTLEPEEAVGTLPAVTPTPEWPTDTPTPEEVEATATPTPELPTPTPMETSTPTATPALTSTPGLQGSNTYVVVPGDTLSAIARRFGVTVEAIARVNNIVDVATLRVGQQLTIPQTSEALLPSSQAESTVYVVAPGDTLGIIARRFGVTVEELARLNGIEDTSRLQVNQRLLIPASAMAQPTPTPKPTPTPAPTPTPTTELVYPAPQLLSPVDGTPFTEGDQAFIELRWQDVGPLRPGEVYVIHLGYLMAQDHVSWFYEEMVQGTSWRVPVAFQTLAPQELGRTFRWYVQVEQIHRDAGGGISGRVPRSPSSAVWSFSWR